MQLFLTRVTHGDGLAGEVVNGCRQVRVWGENHGHVGLQHLAQRLGSGEQNLPGAGVAEVFVELADKQEEEGRRGKPTR